MGLISKALGFNALSMEDPAQPLMPSGALYESLGLGRSDAGILVNSKQAERYPTVFSCVRIISEDLSRISLDILQQMPDSSLRLAATHKNYYLLHDRPNPLMSSLEWRACMLWSVCLHGNGYSWIKRDNAARVIALQPLDALKTSPVMREGVFMYATTQTDTGAPAYIDPENILHFKVNSQNGIVGRSPIQICRNMVGMGLAAEKFGAQLFGNGARTTGVFTHPQRLDPEAYENLKKNLFEVASGDNALRPMILEEGLTYQQLTINPQDAQFLELRKFTKEDCAQTFRIPLHLLQDLTRATNANLEYQGTEYVRHCLMPYAVQMEAEIKYKIIGKGPFIVEHNFQDLTRGDTATQTTAFLALRNSGVYSANDVLRGLRQNPIPDDEGGNIRIVQGAFIPLDSLLDYVAPSKLAATPTDTGDTDPNIGDPAGYRQFQFVTAYRPLFRDAVGRSIHRNGDQDFVKKAFQPAVASMFTGLMASRTGQSELTPGDLELVGTVVDEIATGCSEWTRAEAATIATKLTETVHASLTGVFQHE